MSEKTINLPAILSEMPLQNCTKSRLLFLHGFLGQNEDWDPLLEHLSSVNSTCLDLPLAAPDIALAVREMVPSAKIVVGYSAGGRIALEMKARFPNDYGQVIALSAHPGLTSEEEKRARWEIDREWIELLRSAPLDQFLEKWYSQELFARLKNSPQFESILSRRKTQNSMLLAQFLECSSLAKKSAPELFPNTIFVHGKEDLKYGALYRRLVPTMRVFAVENAGHAVHLENPEACAMIIEGALNEHRRNAPVCMD